MSPEVFSTNVRDLWGGFSGLLCRMFVWELKSPYLQLPGLLSFWITALVTLIAVCFMPCGCLWITALIGYFANLGPINHKISIAQLFTRIILLFFTRTWNALKNKKSLKESIISDLKNQMLNL